MTLPLRESSMASKLWVFQQARALVKRYEKQPPEKGYVLFQTGYGPSGLPHIGTFGEVARATWVRQAFSLMSDIPTKLVAFSDDMDALRKVPDNIPNAHQMAHHIGRSLSLVPDPFGEHESFAHSNNAKLRAFLDKAGFDYEFRSAHQCYHQGVFDQILLKVLKCYQDIASVILPTLGQVRRSDYSPFMPVDPQTGHVLMAKVIDTDVDRGQILYRHPQTGAEIETPVTSGRCKLQWKPDWGMRWAAFDVDYEMYGKDLIPSAQLAGQICRILGGRKPDGFSYELFLDEEGGKISKSKGNGISLDQWFTYAPQESLSLFMFQKPMTAKRLFFDVIPKSVDDYLAHCQAFAQINESQDEKKMLDNPAFHIHDGHVPERSSHLNFSMLLNLASVCNTEDKSVLWGFISSYKSDLTPSIDPYLDDLVGYALNYYRDFVKPKKSYRMANEKEIKALIELRDLFKNAHSHMSASDLQNYVYGVGKNHLDYFGDLKSWFQALYETVLGQKQGPRMGSFFALYGLESSIALLDRVIEGEDLSSD